MKVLVIRFSSIGDVLLTTPLLRCLKQQLENVEIHFLTKKNTTSLLHDNANVDKVIVLQDSLRSTVALLKKEKYDCVVDLHNNHRSRLIRLCLRGKKYVYRKENLRKWLTILTKRDFMSGRHVVDRYMLAVSPLGVKNDGKGLELALPEALCGAAFREKRIGDSTFGELMAQPYAVVACGAQHATKRIPPQKIMALCAMIKDRVLLLGDSSDRSRLDECAASFGPNVVNLCGKTSLLESAALIRDASVVVTSDSSMMHFAAAFHRQVIAVWGATIPQFGFWAYSTCRTDFEVDGLPCRPCSRMGSERCPKGHFECMEKQDWQLISEKVSEAVAENGNNRKE